MVPEPGQLFMRPTLASKLRTDASIGGSTLLPRACPPVHTIHFMLLSQGVWGRYYAGSAGSGSTCVGGSPHRTKVCLAMDWYVFLINSSQYDLFFGAIDNIVTGYHYFEAQRMEFAVDIRGTSCHPCPDLCVVLFVPERRPCSPKTLRSQTKKQQGRVSVACALRGGDSRPSTGDRKPRQGPQRPAKEI